MPRRMRPHLPNTPYHVILRGNNKNALFRKDADRRYFYRLLKEGTERYGHKIIAHCLMDNHIHLAIHVAESPLSEAMHNLGFRYAQHVHRCYSSSGHVFQGRFTSFLVNSQGYMRSLIRYIHLNPVKAHMVGFPDQYLWSSHRAYLGKEGLSWLSLDRGLTVFDDSAEYLHEFILDGIDRDDSFDHESGELVINLPNLVARVSMHFGLDPKAGLLSIDEKERRRIAAVTALLARETQEIHVSQVAAYFGRTPSAIRQNTSRLKAQMKESTELSGSIDQLYESLMLR